MTFFIKDVGKKVYVKLGSQKLHFQLIKKNNPTNKNKNKNKIKKRKTISFEETAI